MDVYRAYLIGDDGRIAGFDKMTCRNDSEALRRIGRLLDGKHVEVWTGARLVTVLRKGGGQENGAGP
jgi:hypothetical protein